jgi:hypothetical protein
VKKTTKEIRTRKSVLTEGVVRKGGVNPPVSGPKPDIKPGPIKRPPAKQETTTAKRE